MRVSRLRLLGFKSFVEPTELVVETGLTGVVGPNGCGKSNLLEALRWVMGETSHKSMRAASMNDVIFSGTATRPSRNWAEVTLFIDNNAREAPAEYNDVDVIEVTRRIERDAGSAYRINGRESRAKDVKILFEDAATGARSPALVRQGQIGDLVNAKPEARRRILEDAAGVAGLHSRRHDAELRLNAAERNLLRLDDVLGGLNGQVESLKRQARQARRYKEFSENIRRTQALVLHLSWCEAKALVQAQEGELRDILNVLGEAVRVEAELVKREVELAEQVKPLREAEAVRAAVFGRLKVESENFEREAQRTQERADELRARAEHLERDIAREENFVKEAAEITRRLEAEISENQVKQTGANEAMAAAQETFETAQGQLASAEERLHELVRQNALQTARRSSIEATLAETDKLVLRLGAHVQKLDAEISEVRETIPEHDRVAQLVATSQTLREQIAATETALAGCAEKVATIEVELRAKREALSEARLSFETLKTERETLAKLLAPEQDSAYPAVVDSVVVEPGFETALGAALGDDLEAPVADDAPVRWTRVETSEADRPLPSGVRRLSEVVEAPLELARRLENIGVVDRSQGAALQGSLGPGQRLVSVDGDLWRWDGFVAACDGVTAAAKRLFERNRMNALAHEEVALAEKVQQCAKAETACGAALEAARTDEFELRGKLREQQAQLSETKEQHGKLERVSQDAQTRLSSMMTTVAQNTADLSQAQEKAASLKVALSELDGDQARALAVSVDEAQTGVQKLRADAVDKQAALASLRRENELRDERVRSQSAELENWRRRAAGASEQIASLRARDEQTRRELEAMQNLPAQMDERRSVLMSKLQDAEREQKGAADAVVRAEDALKEASRSLREAHARVSDSREQRAGAEARLEAARERQGEDERKIQDVVGVAPEACLAAAELEDGAEPASLAEVADRLTRLMADRERLGGVNLQADDELSELAGQLETIETERADVEEAIAKLRGGIAQLNREGRRRLREAFVTVDKHFQRLFSVLFSGGEARLEMIESEEDPLEGGLEIIARPPGKKPATLSLLSGGEQTLTALSLIFAVFLTNPSPICVLDEVDAPLDDANVDRFCTLMEKMSEDTQTRFLVITHHPMTMTRMNRLFGVTMGEKGVSQLVSVDLETAQGFREAG